MSGPGTIGLGLLVYALALHLLVALLAGRPDQAAEMFAIMPEPTVVATLGILEMAVRAEWLLIIVPVAWCVVSWVDAYCPRPEVGSYWQLQHWPWPP